MLPDFRNCPVLIVGDVMLDEYLWGHVARISPEAPVPVVEVQRRTSTLGGAANVAANVASLGGRAILAGVVGSDASAEAMREQLDRSGIDRSALVVDDTRPTTTKTRVVAASQQMVRLDRERLDPMGDDVASRLLDAVRPLLSKVRACVISDYGKGVLTPDFTSRLIAEAARHGTTSIVDPKGTDYVKYAGATVVKPNQLEAGQVLNRKLNDEAAVAAAGAALLAMLGGTAAVLITRGASGMSLFRRGESPEHIPTQAREVFDVTGAGDTVAGTMALSLAAGSTLGDACRIASAAAAVVVAKIGTATCTADELSAALARATG